VTPYYEDASVRLYLGDCREVLPLIDKVDHVITDPPYEAEAHTLQRRVKRGGGVMEVEPLAFAPMDTDGRRVAAESLTRLSRRWILVFCQVEAAPMWRASLEACGAVYKRTCIWVKPDGMPQYTGDRPGMGYETVVALHSAGRSAWNGGGKHGVWTFPKGEDIGANPHPTQKPQRLMEQLVADFTDPGDLILDPFAGSGTTGVAAKRLGRRCILIEKEEKYCEVAAKRLQQGALDLFAPVEEHTQQELDGYGHGV
jgi:DNA modification methylase